MLSSLRYKNFSSVRATLNAPTNQWLQMKLGVDRRFVWAIQDIYGCVVSMMRINNDPSDELVCVGRTLSKLSSFLLIEDIQGNLRLSVHETSLFL